MELLRNPAKIRERIEKRVEVDSRGCWLWQGSKTSGYGTMRVGKEVVYVHKAALMAFEGVGTPPKGYARKCDGPLHCVNPAHWLAREMHQGHPRADAIAGAARVKGLAYWATQDEETREKRTRAKRENMPKRGSVPRSWDAYEASNYTFDPSKVNRSM